MRKGERRFSPLQAAGRSVCIHYDDLLHTDLSLAQILENNGFTNYKLFRKLFRDSYGCTPGELRKKNRGSAEKIIRVASEKGLYSRDLTDQEGVRVL